VQYLFFGPWSYRNIKVFSLLCRAILPCPALSCATGQGRAGMNFIFIPFFPQGRTGQGRASGQGRLEKSALWTSLVQT